MSNTEINYMEGARISGADKAPVDREGDEIFQAPIWDAISRHYEIKAQMARLREEDALICKWLDKQQESDLKALGIKRTVKTNYKVDADKVAEITNGNEHLQEVLNPCLRWKCELSMRPFKALSEEDAMALAPAITATPAKTEYECKEFEKGEEA